MSRLLESTGKGLVANFGITVPEHLIASNPVEAQEAARELGCPVVIKALVPVGKKGKAGAIKVADSPEEARAVAQQIIGTVVRSFPVQRVLVEKKVDIAKEYYASISFDELAKVPVVIASCEGGVDVEEISARSPDKVYTYHVNPSYGLAVYQAREIWAELGLASSDLQAPTDFLWRMYKAFERCDANILEVNPLATTPEGRAVAVGVLMGIDDNALYRHPELEGEVQAGNDRAWRPLTELEMQILEVDKADPYRGTACYTEMEDGDIGFLCGGGGGSLLMLDAIERYGGKPANYTEFGGNPPERKVHGLTKGILSKPGVRGLFVCCNITNNTQTDVVARGIVRALGDMGIDVKTFPILVRLAGVNEAKARETFTAAGIEYYSDSITMEDAAKMMIERMKKA
jgi:succinyl-CoA synthetase beta subunit